MGEVFNDGLRDVVDVWVTADAFNAEGKVVGRGLAFVTSFLPGRGTTTTFTVKLPGRKKLTRSVWLCRRFDMHPERNHRKDLGNSKGAGQIGNSGSIRMA
jgi:hypothetical protein